jgi:nucleotide-binding universal stress UspA family protein
LLATGGPGQTELALQQLKLMAGSIQIQPTVLTVIKHREEQQEASEIIAHAVERLKPDFENIASRVRIGQPWEEIVNEGKTGNYDLIVMGQRQSRPLLSRIRGLVTQKVVAHTTVPVLIAKREAREFRRMLICDSGAQGPTLLQRFRESLPELLENANSITVLHVMSQISAAPRVRDFDLLASAEQLMEAQTREGTFLEQDLAFLSEMNLKLHAIVRHGLVVDEIAQEARSDEYDLVIIGAHRDEGLPRILLDDLAHELVLEVNRAILVVR